jgi:hypothetical protein
MADDEDVTTGTEEEAETDEASTDDGLAEKGRAALAKERAARKAADKARKAAEDRAAEAEAKLAAGAQQDEAQQAAEKTRRDAEAAATKKANERILRSELKAAAAGKLADPSDAAAFIDLTQFEPDADGEFDSTEIAEAISDLIKRKPHLAAAKAGFQGSGDGGARTNGSSAKQLTGADLKNMSAQAIDKARQEGRLERYMSGD